MRSILKSDNNKIPGVFMPKLAICVGMMNY